MTETSTWSSLVGAPESSLGTTRRPVDGHLSARPLSLYLGQRLAGQLLGPPLKPHSRCCSRPTAAGLAGQLLGPPLKRFGGAGGAPSCTPSLAGQLLGPPLKRRLDASRSAGAVPFGRAIARPSIEAAASMPRTSRSEWFGRAIARPSIEARSVPAAVGCAPSLAGQLLGPPLKRAVTCGANPPGGQFGRAIARPSIEAGTARSVGSGSPPVWPGNCSALH